TIFECAKLQDAVLFIDEADSLLSKRLTDVTDGSGNAINAMRSQLLLSLERFEGIAIFATNLVVNYDRAFISRLISIEIPPPDFQGRKAIWKQHIHGELINIPLADDVSIEELAKRYDTFCGREIKKSVMRACTNAVVEGKETVTQKDFLTACQNIQSEAREVAKASDYTQQKLTPIFTPFFR
ncbi:MAG: ATP-binding protein, partial [Synergistaceae bacterium]|nr:ATP-binding protein [Synergistaceae bacterium]